MRTRTAILVLAGLLCAASFPACADDAFNACLKTVGPEDTRCGEEWLAREQARLDAALKQLSDVADGAVADALAVEQRAWTEFRDVSCRFKLDHGFGGAAGPTGYHACVAQVIAGRAAAIEGYVKYIDN